MLENLCKKPLIEKIRHRISLDNLTWEVDEFWGDNQGLIMAEIELEQEDQVITSDCFIHSSLQHDVHIK